ncbi:MAG: hypothetical protein ACRDJS_02815 [Actinomycetota bacterium]
MSFEDQLREKLRRAETQMPLARVSLQETLVGARRGLIVRYALATAVVLVAIAGGAFAANDFLGTDTPTPAPAESPSPQPAPTPTRSESATEEFVDPSLGVPAAKAWIEAMGAGDRERAWDLLTARAQGRFDTYADFAADTGLAEGWATWAFAEDAEYYHHDLPSGDRPTRVVIVTIAGTRQLEGTTERGASAMAVHVDGDRALVDPFVADGGTNIEPVTPREGGDSFEAGKPMLFEAHVPERSMEIYFFISTQPAPVHPAETEPAGGRRVLAHHRLDEHLLPGDYWVTITASLADGSVWTSPVGFRVE